MMHTHAVPVRDDEFPVFWACGVTPQSVVATLKPEFCITHATMLRDKFDLITVELISPIITPHRHPNSRVVS